MTHIIAGRLQLQDQVQHAIAQLIDAGFSEDQISSFYVNPPGQHDLYPIGGDRDKSPGAQESREGMVRGAATGGVIGAVVGVAGIPLGGPLGPAVGGLVGAHIGSLVGSLSEMKDKGESESSAEADTQASDNTDPQRKSGMLVAVGITEPDKEDKAIAVLQAAGADQIERADGTIADGNWEDFNPLKAPELLKP